MTRKEIEQIANQEYKYGFVTEVDSDTLPKGLNEDIIRIISEKKNEPSFMVEWRLKAFRQWQKMKEPHWPYSLGCIMRSDLSEKFNWECIPVPGVFAEIGYFHRNDTPLTPEAQAYIDILKEELEDLYI